MLIMTEEFSISMDCSEGSSSDTADLCLLAKKWTMIEFNESLFNESFLAKRWGESIANAEEKSS